METVGLLPTGVSRAQALELASSLTVLSRFQWRTYTHQASAAGDPEMPNSEAWCRSQEREAFAEVKDGLRHPNLPREDGTMIVSYSPILQSAHWAGRVLRAIDDAELLERVVTDVGLEQAAIGAAELGDLSGRAQQAVELSRPDASPVQVRAAHALLGAQPLGSVALFTELDPATASAAAYWLQAAVAVTAKRTGCDLADVIEQADDIEALPVHTTTLVLDRLHAGQSPRQVVTDLIAEAMAVAEGRLRDPGAVLARLVEIHEHSDTVGPDAQDTPTAPPTGFPISLLDPAHPAIDLLEDLLAGIRGCWLLYREDVLDEAELAGEHDNLDDTQTNEANAALSVKADALFTEEVRAEGAAHHDRLL